MDYTANVLNIQDSGGQGNFLNDAQLGVATAGHAAYGEVDHIAMIARGTIRIPDGGDYTLGINFKQMMHNPARNP